MSIVMQLLRGLGVSVVLGAGLLAIVHLEEPLQIQLYQKASSQLLPQKADVPVVSGSSSSTVLLDLKAQMFGDELLGRSPFMNLSVRDPFEKAMKNVASFERHTLRSPSYMDDIGYDLVHYEIRHTGGQLSQVLAYVANGQVVVMVLAPEGSEIAYAQYADGDLVEVKTMPSTEGQSLFADHLQSSVPFLSVSR